MKRISTICFILIFIAISSCTKDNSYNTLIESMIVSRTAEVSAVLQHGSPLTKMLLDEGEDPNGFPCLHSNWSDTDALTITPDSSDSLKAVKFSIVHGYGSSNGVFKADEDIISRSKSWTVYYPSSVKSESDFQNFIFSNQVQKGNDNTNHLSDFNLMKKIYNYENEQEIPSSITFSGDNFYQAPCIKFVLSGFPEPIEPSMLDIEVYDYYFIKENQIDQKVNKCVYFSQSMKFEDIASTDKIIAYMMLPDKLKSIGKGDYFRVSLTSSDGRKYVTERLLRQDLIILPGTYNIMSLKKNWMIDNGLDGSWGILQEPTSADASQHNCNIVIMGDGYTMEDYEGPDSKFLEDVKAAFDAIFSVEPFKSLRDYFGVYYVNVISGQKIQTVGEYDNGAMNVNANTTFGVTFEPNSTSIKGDDNRVLYYAEASGMLTTEQICRSVMVVLANNNCHAGTCSVYYNTLNSGICENHSIAYIALGNRGDYQKQIFANTVIHEVCGHGFGKLADEYTMNRQYPDLQKAWSNLVHMQNNGIYKNVAKYSGPEINVHETHWAELASVSIYFPEKIGIYEGAYAVYDGFCRSTENSIMNTNSINPEENYFNAISRKNIYDRVMILSGKIQDEVEDSFFAWDAAHLPQAGPYIGTKSISEGIKSPDYLLPLGPPELLCTNCP